MNDNTKSVLHQLVKQNREAPPDADVTLAGGEEEEAGGLLPYHVVRGQKDRAETIEFRTLAPAEPDVTCEYSFRRRTLWHKHNGSIELVFVDDLRVTIEGVNLYDLKEQLRRRRVAWVQECGRDAAAMRAAELEARQAGRPFAWVERIRIEEKEEE